MVRIRGLVRDHTELRDEVRKGGEHSNNGGHGMRLHTCLGHFIFVHETKHLNSRFSRKYAVQYNELYLELGQRTAKWMREEAPMEGVKKYDQCRTGMWRDESTH